MVFRLPRPGEALVANDAAPQRTFVSMTSGLFDPITFTLFYLHGALGWYRVRSDAGAGAATNSTTGRAMRLNQYVRSVALHRSKHAVVEAVAVAVAAPPVPLPGQQRQRSSRERAPSRRRSEADESAALQRQAWSCCRRRAVRVGAHADSVRWPRLPGVPGGA
jgi:hypothetical protein